MKTDLKTRRTAAVALALLTPAMAIAGLTAWTAPPEAEIIDAISVTNPEPTDGSATVDGSISEWTTSDEWGTIVSNDPPKRVVATASLRYDCESMVLYVLVQASTGETFQTTDPAEAYVRLGQSGKLVSGLSGDDGVAPDFAWLDLNGDTASGFEASAVVAPGEYPASLRIHGKLPDDSSDGYETVDLKPRYHDLKVKCDEAAETTTTTTAPPETTSTTAPETTTTSAPETTTTSTTAPETTTSTTTPSTSTTTAPTSPPPSTPPIVEAPPAVPTEGTADFTG